MLGNNTDNYIFHSSFTHAVVSLLSFPDQSLQAVTLSAPIMGRQARVVGGV